MTETSTPSFSTKAVRDNERIVIDPPPAGWGYMGRERTHLERLNELKEIRDGILRHVDGASQRNVSLVWDTKTCCAHCEEPVESGTYGSGEPGCCEKAIADWTASGGVIEE